MFLKNYTPFKVWWYKEPLGETAVLFLLLSFVCFKPSFVKMA